MKKYLYLLLLIGIYVSCGSDVMQFEITDSSISVNQGDTFELVTTDTVDVTGGRTCDITEVSNSNIVYNGKTKGPSEHPDFEPTIYPVYLSFDAITTGTTTVTTECIGEFGEVVNTYTNEITIN